MEETISLKEIFEVIKKRIILILALTFGAAVIAAVVSYFVLTPTYQSSSMFIVNQGQLDPAVQYNVNDIRTNIELINTYNEIIKSPAILDDVVEELDLPYASSALKGKIQVSSAQNSQVVTVTVTDTAPTLATDIANATVEVFQNKIPEIMNVDNVNVLSRAETPVNPKPVAPKPALNIAIALVLGAMVGVGLSFLLEYLDNSIKTEADIEKKLRVPVLGVVSHIDEEDIRFEQQRMSRGGGFHATQKKTS